MKIDQRRWTEATGWVPDTPGAIRESVQLVLVFGATPALREQKHFQDIEQAYPGAHIFGCSTAGEICGTQVTDDALVTTAVSFEYTQLKGVQIKLSEVENSFKRVSAWPCPLIKMGWRMFW